MNLLTDILVVLVVLTNLRVLGLSRLSSSIGTVALQGALLGLLPVLAHIDDMTTRLALQAAASTLIKAAIFPWLLGRALRGAGAQLEEEPFVGLTASLAAGVLFLAASQWIGTRLPHAGPGALSHMVPIALFTMFVGLFMIVSRRLALTQVLGYLIMENGITTFGLAFAEKQPLLVELGILLDVFMAVFVMGITLFLLRQEFDHLDAARMTELKD